MQDHKEAGAEAPLQTAAGLITRRGLLAAAGVAIPTLGFLAQNAPGAQAPTRETSAPGKYGYPSTYSPTPVTIYTSPKWIRVVFGGKVVADSRQVLLVYDYGGIPVYYFPKKDVRTEYLKPSNHRTVDPTKGEASYYTLQVGDKVSEDAAWHFPKPSSSDPDLKNPPDLREYVSFVWEKVDGWYEEGEEIFRHARDPYKRIDVLNSTRHVRVILGGETVAETRRPVILFETGIVPRYYIPKEDVRRDLLVESDHKSQCPYKGVAGYYSVQVGQQLFKDIIWYYRFPLPEVARIANNLAFYNERVDDIVVDGEKLPKEGLFGDEKRARQLRKS
ncbi:MAG: DUF427 domain-containing protein [Acidobacteriota bacterium]|nr:DUF427 domain-containing protein [Acidobacteriota bacterium]